MNGGAASVLIPIRFPKLSHIGAALRGLLSTGWTIAGAPTAAKLPRNGSRIVLNWDGRVLATRLFIYKVTESSRNRNHERRIEITSTYKKGLVPDPSYVDLVLGYDDVNDVFVGVDARRLNEGGKTSNASTFVHADALLKATETSILVLRRASALFGTEQFAYFKPPRLAEYLISAQTIHLGEYDGLGPFSKNQITNSAPSLSVSPIYVGETDLSLAGPTNEVARPVWKDVQTWTAFENEELDTLQSKKLSNVNFTQLQERRNEIGLKGEEYVLVRERRRLRRAGKPYLADKVEQISVLRPFEGFDILSFELDGTERYVEVKTSTGTGRKFPITDNEWRVAGKHGPRYHICRVTEIEGKPKVRWLVDPVELLKQGTITLTPFNWVIVYNK